jgi:hypothetical protein
VQQRLAQQQRGHAAAPLARSCVELWRRAQWWRLQPIIDVLDFLVIAREWRRGAVPGPAAGLMGGTALLATALGAASLGSETP